MTEDIQTPGAQGLVLREKSIFDRSVKGRKGYQLPALDVPRKEPSNFVRKKEAQLPEVSELEVVRHFTRLSSWNYSIDSGPFPLGSCTMKYNPRINEELAAISGLANIHPDLPDDLCQGALKTLDVLSQLLCDITGLEACTLQPAAGALGEFTGLLSIRAFHEAHGSTRKYVVVPDSAHGTNPATCTLAGYQALTVKVSEQGIVDTESVQKVVEEHGREIAGMMVTNPSTLGLFESKISEVAELLHSVGAQLYMDGANLNAIMGQAKPWDMGVDVMHINLHKTFSTPHGGGGPGSGPVLVRKHLAPYLPNPRVELVDGKYRRVESEESIGKVKGALGNFGMFVRALSYILAHGSDGITRVSKNAVINANYIKAKLRDHYHVAFDSPSFHEVVFSDKKQNTSHKVTTLKIAKALIDKGFHPPTVYFPLVVPGAMLVEPCETESLGDIDTLVQGFIEIAQAIESGEENFEQAPRKTIVGKVDETLAARKPILTIDDRA